jgi:hypothetical protein
MTRLSLLLVAGIGICLLAVSAGSSPAAASLNSRYATRGSAAQRKAIQTAMNVAAKKKLKALRAKVGWKIYGIEVGRERATASHGRDVRGWANAGGEFNCEGCAFQAILKRVSARPLRYRVVSFFGPTGGVIGSCYTAYWGGKFYESGKNNPPVRLIRRLPGAVVWAFEPVCMMNSTLTVEDFYHHANPRLTGPTRVGVGGEAIFRATGLPPRKHVTLTAQPKAAVGGNCCGIVLRKSVSTGKAGRATFRISWPYGYYEGETLTGWTTNEEIVVTVSTIEPMPISARTIASVTTAFSG